MASGLESVPAPATSIYRISRPTQLFAPPPWEIADPETGTFDGRFDDPGKLSGIPEVNRFRIIYCASQRAGAFAETIARFRPPLATLASYQRVQEDENYPIVRRPVVDHGDPTLGIVPLGWRSGRRIGSANLDPSLRFVDIASPGSMNHLRAMLSQDASVLGLQDVDLSTLTGDRRAFTQLCARYVYAQVGESDAPAFAGIRYISRLNPDWVCWAVFDTRAVYEIRSMEPISERDPDLLAVAAMFNLSVERDEPGDYIRP